MRIIIDERDIEDGISALVEGDARLAPVLEKAGMPPVRRNPGGFEGLCRIIVAQQLSVASASAIWGKVSTRFPDVSARDFIDSDMETLRACGLSAPKIRTLRAIAEAIDGGALPISDLATLPADEAHALLTAVKGVGPWTADIYLMFCLGHADAFAPGDLALQEAVRIAFSLEKRPSAKALADIAEAWRPWRGVAARLLWAYYKEAKSRSGIV